MLTKVIIIISTHKRKLYKLHSLSWAVMSVNKFHNDHFSKKKTEIDAKEKINKHF